jgi:hypothetical protein
VTRFARGDFATLVERVRRITRRDSESTALWDGFRSYLGAVTEQPGRHALVVFTDGRDTASTATFQHVLRAFRGSAVTVFSVDFGEARGSAHELQLRQISEETGGAMMFAYTRNQMDDVYRRIVGEVRSQYGLGYVSTDPRQDGRWRDVTIRLVRPEHQRLRLRTRAGITRRRLRRTDIQSSLLPYRYPLVNPRSPSWPMIAATVQRANTHAHVRRNMDRQAKMRRRTTLCAVIAMAVAVIALKGVVTTATPATTSGIILLVGADESQRVVNWYASANTAQLVQVAPTSKLVNGEFPATRRPTPPPSPPTRSTEASTATRSSIA